MIVDEKGRRAAESIVIPIKPPKSRCSRIQF